MVDDRLGAFLRSKREGVDPARVGIEATSRRRTVGLRREEVAQMASVSLDYYSRLEQNRASNPSAEVLAAISAALQLDWENHSHLLRLAGRDAGFQDVTTVRPGIIKLLDRLDGLCAVIVLDHASDVLAWNELATSLFVDFAAVDPDDRNLMLLLLTDSEMRSRIPDGERRIVIDAVVADFRAQSVRATDRERVGIIVDRLNQPGTEFAAAWESRDVAHFAVCVDHVVHPDVGSVRLDVEFFDIADTGQRMVVSHAADDVSQQRVDRLSTRSALQRR